MKIRSRARIKRKARIEIIPMIDTMFFLLVFFMIAALSMAVFRGMPVNLPQTETGQKDIKVSVFVTLSKEGKIYYNKQAASLSELASLLKADADANPDLLVILNADKEVTHGQVMEVIDHIKLLAIKRFAVATSPKR
jgi:biopolymer transport protein ExbD